MADFNVSRFKKIADESTATSKARSENLGLSRDTSISSLAESAKKQVEATTQDVAQYSTDSGSSASKIATAITLATGIMSLASTGVSIYQAIKGGGKSASSGSGASGAVAAGSGDPVKDIANAVNQHQQLRSKASQRALTDAIATGNSKISELTTKKTGLEEEVTTLASKTDADYKNIKETLEKDIKAQDNIITDSNEKISEYSKVQEELKKSSEDLNVKVKDSKTQVTQAENDKAQAQTDVAQQTETTKKAEDNVITFEAKNTEDVKKYQDCLGKKDTLAQNTQKAEASYSDTLKNIDNLKNQENALKITIKSNKEKDNNADVNNAERELGKVQENIKNEEDKKEKLEKEKDTAKKAEEANNKEIKKYEETITANGKTLAELKTNAESAKTAKAEAEKTLNAKCEELKAYVKVQEDTTEAAETTADKAKEVEAKKELTTEQLRDAVTGKDKSIKLQDDYTKAKELNDKAIEEKKAQIKELNTEINKIANAVKQGNSALGLEVLNDQLPSMSELEVDDSKVEATVDGKKVSLEKVSDGKYKVAGSTDGKLYSKDGKEIKADAKPEKSAGTQQEEKAGQVVKPDAKPTSESKAKDDQVVKPDAKPADVAKEDNQWFSFSDDWKVGTKRAIGYDGKVIEVTRVTSTDGKTKAYELNGKYYALDNYGYPDFDKEIDKKDFKK